MSVCYKLNICQTVIIFGVVVVVMGNYDLEQAIKKYSVMTG